MAERHVEPDEVRAAVKEQYGDPADGQHYNDRAKLDFDPADGLYSGTAVEGTSEIAGPHENQDTVGADGSADSGVDGTVTESVEQRAAEGEASARYGPGRTAETEAASSREPGDVAAGREIDYGASRDGQVDAPRHAAPD
jgi:hypothetical protein